MTKSKSNELIKEEIQAGNYKKKECSNKRHTRKDETVDQIKIPA